VLAQRFLRRQGPLLGISTLPRLSRAAQDALLTWRWPGNVRELENCLQRAVIIANGGEITVAHLGIAPPSPESGPGTDEGAVGALEDARLQSERGLIAQALAQSSGSRTLAAQRLGISPRTLRHKLQRFREAGLDLL